ncbi:glycoside hydrolase family 30 beta sandwich domain-containing protein [Sorangium sp. So ce117]|uniref:glycoside hydrolase family 30 beta sandwich domain-containing protein n=1 Tax=Sorangium sp. So ce117 TaxID=3133277 RepID=UPI003F602CA8
MKGCTPTRLANRHALAADPDAWAAFDILGTHQYDTQVAYPGPDDVPPRGDKEVWQTEMSGVKWWPEQGPSNTIENGVAIARWVHSALVVGEANAWLWWWYSGNTTNEGLIQQSGSVTTKRYYTFGNFTRYIRPGYHRVAVTGVFPEKVLVSAYANDSGKVVVVAINETTSAQTVPLAFRRHRAKRDGPLRDRRFEELGRRNSRHRNGRHAPDGPRSHERDDVRESVKPSQIGPVAQGTFIRAFCSACTRPSVQNLQLSP